MAFEVGFSPDIAVSSIEQMDEPKKHSRPITLRLRDTPEISAQMKLLHILFLNEHGKPR